MDALSAMLDVLRIRGSVYFWANLGPPWGLQVPAFGHVVRYHLILRGHCWVRVDGVPEPIRLEAGDLVAIPHGRGHRLSDQPTSVCIDVDRVIEAAGFTGEGALVVGLRDAGLQTRMVCGHFAHDGDEEHPLFRALPPTIVVRGVAGDGEFGWLDDILRYIAREVAAQGPGTTAVVSRLSEILFIQTLRSYAISHPEDSVGWAGFVDPHVGPVLVRIHERPDAPVSVGGLARTAGLSRTRFALRFRRLMGTTPLAYVARWRLLRARAELRDPSRSVADVASQCGYRSESAFNRAFTRAFRVGPGAFRRASAGGADGSPQIHVKRVHDPWTPSDGLRILVDRLWPRGVAKRAARVDAWIMDVAPSDVLRRWFGHDPQKWRGFVRRYHAELRRRPEAVAQLRAHLAQGPVTLLFGAADRDRNNAVALAEYLRHFHQVGGE